jgi:hypothetical protein
MGLFAIPCRLLFDVSDYLSRTGDIRSFPEEIRGLPFRNRPLGTSRQDAGDIGSRRKQMSLLKEYDDVVQEVKAKEIARRRALALRNLIPDVDSAVATSMRMDILGKGLDVYGFILNGIEAAQRVQETIAVVRSTRLLSESESALAALKETAEVAKVSEAVEAGESIMEAERFLFAANVLGVLTTYVGVWMSIAGAWAAAKADILTDNSASGASRGVVLGGNDCGPHYVSQFWMFSNPSYPAYREVERTARNMYNIGLVAGYGAGKSLTRNQKGNLFRYIHGNMTNATRGLYSGNFKDWTLKKKQDYYIDCGAIFRANVLAD